MIDENGEIWVMDFVVAREGYGEAKFLGKTNVADLNLDEIGEYYILKWLLSFYAEIF